MRPAFDSSSFNNDEGPAAFSSIFEDCTSIKISGKNTWLQTRLPLRPFQSKDKRDEPGLHRK